MMNAVTFLHELRLHTSRRLHNIATMIYVNKALRKKENEARAVSLSP